MVVLLTHTTSLCVLHDWFFEAKYIGNAWLRNYLIAAHGEDFDSNFRVQSSEMPGTVREPPYISCIFWLNYHS